MKRMLLVECSKMKTRKGLSSFIVPGMLMGMTSMVVVAAASVPVSSTLSTAWWDTCGSTGRIQFELECRAWTTAFTLFYAFVNNPP